MNKTNHHVQIAGPIGRRVINFHKLIFIKPRTSHVDVDKVAYSARRELRLASVSPRTTERAWIATDLLPILRLLNAARQVPSSRREIPLRSKRCAKVLPACTFRRTRNFLKSCRITFCITRLCLLEMPVGNKDIHFGSIVTWFVHLYVASRYRISEDPLFGGSFEIVTILYRSLFFQNVQ